MITAILFWCFKEPEACADRARLLRHHNPETPIYVLYGGNAAGQAAMQTALAPFVDDFWSYDLDHAPYWKWINGDRLIARWHERRGRHLQGWDRLFVVQWDMLVAAPVATLLEGMPDGASMFSGRLPVSEVQDWWHWVKGRKGRNRLALFRLRLLLFERYAGTVFTAPFIVVCAPRAYFDRLVRARLPLMGFIEYRCATLAEAWGFAQWTTPQLDTWRPGNPATRHIPENRRIISAAKEPVDMALVASELARPDGFRVFHPVHATDDEAGLTALLYPEG